jgi:hypothetical protein
MDPMVTPEISKAVLEAVVSAHPDDGAILGLRMREGWGNAYHIDIHTRHVPGTSRDREQGGANEIREAILAALTPRRASISFSDIDPWLLVRHDSTL